jgi:predicted ABC-type ATPase
VLFNVTRVALHRGMSSTAPTIYLIAGCNGAGKTTFAKEFLPTELKCLRFLNPDEIARGISPLDPQAGLFAAGRILLEQFRNYIARGESFTFESTLSGRTYVALLKEAKAAGFQIEAHYLVVLSPEFAMRRVRARVAMGGHDVSEEDVRRRFFRSRENFVRCYLPLADRWVVWNAGGRRPEVLADSKEHDIELVKQLLL